MIPVRLTEAEVEAVLAYLGPIIERWGPSAGEPLAAAHDKLDMALLHHSENRVGQARA